MTTAPYSLPIRIKLQHGVGPNCGTYRIVDAMDISLAVVIWDDDPVRASVSHLLPRAAAQPIAQAIARMLTAAAQK